MSSKTMLVIVVILVVLGVSGVVGYNLYNKNAKPAPSVSTQTDTTTTPNSTLSTSTPVTNTIIAADAVSEGEISKKRFTTSNEKLVSWSLYKTNANFTGLFITLDPKLELNSANEVYVFDSPDDTNNHYTVSLAQSSGNTLRAIIPISDYQGTLLPIKKEFWQVQYVEALQIAHKNGGQEFISANTVTNVEMKLVRADPKDFLYWVITYHTKDIAKSFTIKVDANDKSVTKE